MAVRLKCPQCNSKKVKVIGRFLLCLRCNTTFDGLPNQGGKKYA